MDVGEVQPVSAGSCADLYLVETGMYDVTGYGAAYIIDAERPAIIETGIGTQHEALLDALDTVGIDRTDVETIAMTHVHLDHAGGAGYLADACPAATVIAHEIGTPHLADPDALVAGTKQAVGDQWEYYVEPRPVPESRLRPIVDGDTIDIGDYTLRAHHVPGHAPHQVIFHVPSMEAVFTGDAAGIWIPEWEEVHQTSPPPQFDLDQAVADLDTIAALDPQTLLFTHFGPAPYSDSLLRNYEQRLARWIRDVDTAYNELPDEAAVIDHFTEETDIDAVWGSRKARGEIAVNVAGAKTYLERIRGED